MTVRTLRLSIFAALTTLMLLGTAGVARAQEGPIDHLRYRTHQIIRETHRIIGQHHPPVVRVYVSAYPRHYHRYRAYDRRHHRYYWAYRRY
jgi:hypothetical protein